MKVKCDYCGSMIEENVPACPNCGAALNGVNRFADKQPRTIEELKEWYISRKLPPEEVTRFFIGKDIREARAFGIYQNALGDFVVYKNKSNGQRAIRYQGSDEAYAVNELYQRLRAEIAEQKSRNGMVSENSRQSGASYTSFRKNDEVKAGADRMAKTVLKMILAMGIFWTAMVVFIAFCIMRSVYNSEPTEGYYRYSGDTYYYQDDYWYYYNDLQDDWSHVDSSQVPDITFRTQGEYKTYDHEGMQFEDSSWYVEEPVRNYDSYDSYDDYDDDWDDDWDSDYDWDSGDSWDSGSSDWDSDW